MKENSSQIIEIRLLAHYHRDSKLNSASKNTGSLIVFGRVTAPNSVSTSIHTHQLAVRNMPIYEEAPLLYKHFCLLRRMIFYLSSYHE